MDISQEDFENKFRETVDDVLRAMAEHEEVNPEKFYSMACIMENLAFFSPVIYDALQVKKREEE